MCAGDMHASIIQLIIPRFTLNACAAPCTLDHLLLPAFEDSGIFPTGSKSYASVKEGG